MSRKRFWRDSERSGYWWQWWKNYPRVPDPDEVNRLMGQPGTTIIGQGFSSGLGSNGLITEDEVDYAKNRRKTKP